MRPKSWPKSKSSKSLKINFFEKKFLPAYLCKYDLHNSFGNFKKPVLEIFKFG